MRRGQLRGNGGRLERWPSELQMLSMVASAVFEERPDLGLTWPEILNHERLGDFEGTGSQIYRALLDLRHKSYTETVGLYGSQHAQEAALAGEKLHNSGRITRITENGMQVFEQLVAKEFEAASQSQ
jgi:hypothetical protein